MTRLSRLILAALLVASIPAAAQFSEQVDVNVVLLDAIVVDADGNQILGLVAKDFVVRENGVEKAIDGVDYYTSRRLVDPSERSPFKVDHEERLLLFFFDKPQPGGDLREVMLARDAVRRFIDREMLPNDRAAIVGHDMRLKVYSDFTSDRQKLGRALDQVARFGAGLHAGEGETILRQLTEDRLISGSSTVYQAIHVLADALKPIRGRKNLILLSKGIREPGEDIRNGMVVGSSRWYDPMMRALNAANVTVFGVNITPGAVSAIAHHSLSRMTRETNGVYFGNNTSIDPALERIESATSGYYLIAYRTQRRKGERGFQKVDVSVRNPEFKVRARPGYSYGH
jgi:VWFA-related protein